MDEILRRLRFIGALRLCLFFLILSILESDGSLNSINQKRLQAFERFFEVMERKALLKARSGCGNQARNMHGSILDGLFK
jgi:hypothetical protein